MMPRKKKIPPTTKSQKTDKSLNDDINKIIKVTMEQNLAIGKILKINSFNKTKAV